MYKRLIPIALLQITTIFTLAAQTSYKLSFDGRNRNAIHLTPADTFSVERGYGFDFVKTATGSKSTFLSVAVPDGNYHVSVTIGSKRKAGSTTVRAESRRLFIENEATKKGEFRTISFVVNKRNTVIYDKDGKAVDRVRIKKREEPKLNWDDRLTLEFSGENATVSDVSIEPASEDVTTIWLCGNSTVVDQDYEPWASWGQMIPRWFNDKVCFANYAESGETASTFIAAGRLKKILSLMKKGDYILVEFGHNDQKQKFAGAGAYYNFAFCLKQFIDEARLHGATPIFVTPTQRRSFVNGRIKETHGDYPDAMREVAKREGISVIELHDMTRTFYETLGETASTKAFVHYPANTFPGQSTALADNTHFNPYGAYEIAKMVIEGMKILNIPVIANLRSEYKPFSPSQPDAFESFHWTDSPFYEALKPDGN